VEQWCVEIEAVFERHLIPPKADVRTIGPTCPRAVTLYIMPIPETDSVLAAPPLRAKAANLALASSPARHVFFLRTRSGAYHSHTTLLQTDGVLTHSTLGNGQISRLLPLITKKSPKSFHLRTRKSREYLLSQTYAENNSITAPGRTSPLVIQLSPEDGQTLTP
jgi:hypothetical protein